MRPLASSPIICTPSGEEGRTLSLFMNKVMYKLSWLNPGNRAPFKRYWEMFPLWSDWPIMHICSLDQTPAICSLLSCKPTTCSWPAAQALQECTHRGTASQLISGCPEALEGGSQRNQSSWVPTASRHPQETYRDQEGPRGKGGEGTEDVSERKNECCLCTVHGVLMVNILE